MRNDGAENAAVTNRLTFLIGGARSGKSALAVRLANAHAGPVTFIATAEARDAEMATRISAHQASRPPSWTTLEVPRDLAAVVAAAPPETCLVVDCLTLWVANVGAVAAVAAAPKVAGIAAARSGPTVMVSNEVGSGIVPFDPEVREYRDALGTVNRLVAAAAGRVLLVVAGRALPLPAEL